jgi:hypothetical protein
LEQLGLPVGPIAFNYTANLVDFAVEGAEIDEV